MTLSRFKVGDWVRIGGRLARITRQVAESARVTGGTWVRWGGTDGPWAMDGSTEAERADGPPDQTNDGRGE